jgi:hypothetical protein
MVPAVIAKTIAKPEKRKEKKDGFRKSFLMHLGFKIEGRKVEMKEKPAVKNE